MEQYVIFVDECGTKELLDDTQPLYCLCGLLCRKADQESLTSDIDSLKVEYFGNSSVELKSYRMRNPSERKKHYLDPFQLSEDRFKEFSTALFERLRNMNFRLVAATVNKPELRRAYRFPHNPNAIAYETLMQRLGNICHDEDMGLEVVFDDMNEGKTPAGNKWRDLLLRQHKSLIKNAGTDLTKGWSKPMDYKCISPNLKYVDSEDCCLIQIADICAYSIRKQCERYWRPKAFSGFYWGYEQIRSKIHTHPQKKSEINGYGITCFPTRR